MDKPISLRLRRGITNFHSRTQGGSTLNMALICPVTFEEMFENVDKLQLKNDISVTLNIGQRISFDKIMSSSANSVNIKT